ncbi:MAG: hypothetical protein DRP02_02220 [Candidatus Gerdarchaeota archaeon]|nr:MAG: hypothetical protein DRP02_02220 [Candidatus Gerdarchaeota archaeon]
MEIKPIMEKLSILVSENNFKSILYLIQCGEFVKIGVTDNLQKRIKTFQTGNPFPLKVLYARDFHNAKRIERNLHRKYKKHRHRLEWFRKEFIDFKNLTRFAVYHQYHA